MYTKKVILFEDRPEVTLTAYTRPGKRPAMIVVPGGGYEGVAEDYEGDCVAARYLSWGFNAFVLRYSVGKGKADFPRPLKELSAAIVHVRRNAEEYSVDGEKVFLTGFSAGGHLVGAGATMWHRDFAKCCPDMEYGENRPTGVVYCYPCITTEGEFAHPCPATFKGELTVEDMSIEKQVSDKTPPAFIWHSSKDDCVHVMNSLLLAEAYARLGIDFELRVYNEGGHGTSLGTYGAADMFKGKNSVKSAAWIDDAARWALEF